MVESISSVCCSAPPPSHPLSYVSPQAQAEKQELYTLRARVEALREKVASYDCRNNLGFF